MGTVLAVCISKERGTKKTEVPFIDIRINHGILGDAHAGDWHRQISLLADESINSMRDLNIDVSYGDFAENIVTKGINLKSLPLGTILCIGSTKIKVTQIGKKCHNDCEIKRLVGTCVMPTDGVFAEVVKEGRITPGDYITVCGDAYETC